MNHDDDTNNLKERTRRNLRRSNVGAPDHGVGASVLKGGKQGGSGAGQGALVGVKHTDGSGVYADPLVTIAKAITAALDPTTAPGPVTHIVSDGPRPGFRADGRRGWMRWERDSWKRFRFARGACERCKRTLIPKTKAGVLYRHHRTDDEWCGDAPEEKR